VSPRSSSARRPQPEYVTDVPYVRAFEDNLSPVRLRLVCALNGFAPPPADGFDYCELGSAHGDTTATLAAAYPRSRFVGVDINPDHIGSARKMAGEGGLENVRFLEADFADLAGSDLPAFDFITAHGVMSWISPAKRKALLDFARARLKPGGLLHVSYNALPGWAPIEPLRQLIVGRAALASGNSLEGARQALEFAARMSDLGAEYFTSNPAARAMIEKMTKLGLSYVVHEYMHAHWVPMYFAQVASEMAASDLYFVGQLPLYLNYRDLSIPESLAGVFAGVSDRVAFEALKDFALNEYFRRDVFVKGRPSRTESITQSYLDGQSFGGPLSGAPIARDAKLPHHSLEFAGPIFDALLPALAEGAATVSALARRPEIAPFGLPRTRDAVMRLALTDTVVPMLEETRARALDAPENALYRVPSAYNRATLRAGLAREAPISLASSAAGTGVELSTVEALAVLLVTEVPPASRSAWIRARAESESFRLTVRGQVVLDKEAKVRVLTEETRAFYVRRLPKLLELGVLALA
jgi:SAM-dependent methyltransferase